METKQISVSLVYLALDEDLNVIKIGICGSELEVEILCKNRGIVIMMHNEEKAELLKKILDLNKIRNFEDLYFIHQFISMFDKNKNFLYVDIGDMEEEFDLMYKQALRLENKRRALNN